MTRSAAKKTLVYAPTTLESLRAEYQDNLRRLRIFIPGASGLFERDACELALTGAARRDSRDTESSG